MPRKKHYRQLGYKSIPIGTEQKKIEKRMDTVDTFLSLTRQSSRDRWELVGAFHEDCNHPRRGMQLNMAYISL